MRYVSKSLVLLGFAVGVCCIVYPLTLWTIGQTVFPAQANGSLVTGPDGTPVGSRLIAQPFTKDEYFQPRPSAVSYDASASAPSNLAASNYMLRNRVAGILGPLVKYRTGPKAGQPVGADVERWFVKDQFHGEPHLVAQWADAHNAVAQAWTKADPTHATYVDEWAKAHPKNVEQWVKDNPDTPAPAAADLAVVFFEDFSKQNPGKWLATASHTTDDGKTESSVELVTDGTDMQSTFFDMWRDEHADADLESVPADMVMTSGSGLDPNITLANARYQLDRVATQWAKDLSRDPADVRREIDAVLEERAAAPLGGFVGTKLINVLEVNLELRQRYGAPAA
ncbi:MAG: potassium-transporting ATPase subunit C [Gemmatimonadales bacterium]